MLVSKELLRDVRYAALRRRVWYKVLDEIERGIINLTINVVDSVKSPTLFREISKILVKLQEAVKGAFTKYIEDYGHGKLVDVIKLALGFGNRDALKWGTDSFALLLAVNNYNNPVGWRTLSG